MKSKYNRLILAAILAVTGWSCQTSESEVQPDSQKMENDRLLVKLGGNFYGIDTTTHAISWKQEGFGFGIHNRKLVINTGFWAKEIPTLRDTALLESESFLTAVDASSGQKTPLSNPLTVDYRLPMAFGDMSQNPDGRFSVVTGIHDGVAYVRRRTARNKETLKTWISAVDVSAGKILWQADIPEEYPQTVSFSDERIFIGFSDQSVCFDLKTGMNAHRYDMGYVNYVGGDHLYFKKDGGTLVALHGKTGDKQWEFTSQDRDGKSNQCLLAGHVLLVSGKVTLDAIDARTGSLLWSKTGLNKSANQPVQWMNDQVFMATQNYKILSLEVGTGDMRWESEPIVYRDYMTGNPSANNDARRPNFLAKNGRIIVQSNMEVLTELSPATGEVLPTPTRTVMMGAMGTISDFYLLMKSSVDI